MLDKLRLSTSNVMTSLNFMGESREDVMRRVTITREAFGWRQADLARKLGITPQQWGHYEKLRNDLPREIASALCSQTGVTLDWIYRGVEALLPPMVTGHLAKIRESNRRRRA